MLVHLVVIIRRDIFMFYFCNKIKKPQDPPGAFADRVGNGGLNSPFSSDCVGSLWSFLLFSSFWLLLNNAL